MSGSKYHWIGYDEEKFVSSYKKYLSIQKGIAFHSLAKQCIDLGVKLPKSAKAFNQYVNDAIGYRMATEQVLFYSYNAFGTADAISFRDKLLRIHDLKTGVSPVSLKQLEIYAALFCLEYQHEPKDINIELRIYQTDNIVIHSPEPEDITFVMDKIIVFDKKIEILKMEE